jgi:hypothetical protein
MCVAGSRTNTDSFAWEILCIVAGVHSGKARA